MLIGRRLEPREKAAHESAAAGGNAWPHSADVSDAAAVDGAVAAALERWERIDVLVNNAGIAEERAFLEIEDEGWDRILATNLRGAFLMAQRVARAQVTAGGGAIVHIALTPPWHGPYASYNA
jgi:NAD(P)-dependent dehydrogenase (short-subunit alcohol dehydrogenase family)